MPLPLEFRLPDLVKDINRSFWNGSGTFVLTDQQLAQQMAANPTFAGLRAALGSSFLASGAEVKLATSEAIQLGEENGGTEGFSVGLEAGAGAAVRIYLVLDQKGLNAAAKALPNEAVARLPELVNLGNGGAVVVWFTGNAGLGLTSQVINKPGASVDLTFKAGAGFSALYCRPAGDDDKLLGALGDAFSSARLPQTSLAKVHAKGGSIQLRPGEILLSRYLGALKFGLKASYGYNFKGNKDLQLGQLDLSTTLELQAKATLSFGYGLTGAFEVSTRAGEGPGWMRVVVDKDRTSTFAVAFDVIATASLDTPGVKNQQGLDLIESILGVTTPQVLTEALEWARKTPEELKAAADGFIKGVVTKWVGKGLASGVARGGAAISGKPTDTTTFEELDISKIRDFLSSVSRLADEIGALDGRLVSLYEKFLDQIRFPELMEQLDSILKTANPRNAKERLLGEIEEPKVHTFLEDLFERPLGTVFVQYEELLGDTQSRVQKFQKLVAADAKGKLREFIKAKQEALELVKLVAEIQKYGSLEELRAKADDAVKELADRLLGSKTEDLLKDGTKANKAIKQLNDFAAGFDKTVARINDFVAKALNAKGRLAISAAYSRVATKEKLLDVEVHVGTDQAPDTAGLALYRQAVAGNFSDLFEASHLSRLRIHSARLTDSVAVTKTLSVNIAGWSYRSVFNITSDLDSSIEVGADGFITVYNLSVEGKRSVQGRKRSTDLGYLLSLAGTAEGAIASNDELRRRAVNVVKLDQIQNQFDYQLEDPVASLDELQTYFNLGRQLGVVDQKQVKNLMASVTELKHRTSAEALAGVKIAYTSSFQGTAMLAALKTDYSDGAGKKNAKKKNANQKALTAMFIDRLIASYPPPIKAIKARAGELGVPTLFQKGFFDDFQKDGSIKAKVKKWGSKKFFFEQSGRKLLVKITKQEVAWASTLCLSASMLSSFLDKYRQKLTKKKKITVGDLEKLLKKLVGKLDSVSRDALNALPLLIIDEMVRRSSGGDPEVREALFEITLLDEKGNELSYIPITS